MCAALTALPGMVRSVTSLSALCEQAHHVTVSATRHDAVDPHGRAGLSVIPRGHLTYLVGEPTRRKARGKAACQESQNDGETASSHVWRVPDGKVKAGLPEPQCPICKYIRLDKSMFSPPRQCTPQGLEGSAGGLPESRGQWQGRTDGEQAGNIQCSRIDDAFTPSSKTIPAVTDGMGTLLGSKGVFNPHKDTNGAPKPWQTARTERVIV